jgi:hypothetical protein
VMYVCVCTRDTRHKILDAANDAVLSFCTEQRILLSPLPSVLRRPLSSSLVPYSLLCLSYNFSSRVVTSTSGIRLPANVQICCAALHEKYDIFFPRMFK